MRYLNLAAAIACASVAAACTPPMTTYTYPRYGFSADFPAPPKVEDTVNPQTGARVSVLDSQGAGRDFAVTISEVDPKRDIDALVEEASDAMAKLIGGEVTYRTYASTAEGVLGREEVFTKNGYRAVRARFYLSGPRFYILTAKSVMGLNPGADTTVTDPSTQSGKDSDPAVEAFLDSFHVTLAAKP